MAVTQKFPPRGNRSYYPDLSAFAADVVEQIAILEARLDALEAEKRASRKKSEPAKSLTEFAEEAPSVKE